MSVVLRGGVMSEGVACDVIGLMESVGCTLLEGWRDGSGSVERKGDGSPVTWFDRHAEACLREGLLGMMPGVAIVSEEDGCEEEPEGVGESLCWIVDPLDGTRGFVEGREDFTINVALLERRRPLMGFLHRPVSGETLWGGCGEGVKGKCREGDVRDVRGEGGEREGERVTVVCSRGRGGEFVEKVKKVCPSVRFLRQDAATKFMSLLKGEADVYVQLGETYVWDTVAAQAMVEEMGGGFWKLEGGEYRVGDYRAKNPPFFAVRRGEYREVAMDILRRVGL